MKTKTFILTFLMMFCSYAFGQMTSTPWGDYNPRDYEYSMNVTTAILMDGVEMTDTDLELGVFYDGQLRGCGRLVASPNASHPYLVPLTIHGNETGDVDFLFKLFDHKTNSELPYSLVVTMKAGQDMELGNITNPYLGIAFISVAETNGVKYGTLQGAVDAAQDGGIVKLLVDATDAGVVINKDVTIDFDGNTYTANKGVGSAGTETLGFQILKGNNVTLTNGTFVAGDGIKMLVQNYANLTVDNMTLDGTSLIVQYVLSNNSGTVNIENTVITANANGVAFDVCKYANYAVPTVNVKSGTFTGKIEVTPEINNNLNISGGTFTAEIEEAWCAEGYIPVENTDGTWTVKEGKYIAQVGDVKYETLPEAVEAAAGQEVKLLCDAEGAGLKINKSVTIDLGGYTYTINQAVGSAGTESQGFQLLKNNDITIKNGTVAVAAGTNVKWMFNAYANLTLNGVTVDCANMATPAANEYNYVLVVNNGGSATPTVNYSNVTINGFSAANAPIWIDPTTKLVAGAGLESIMETETGYFVVYENGAYSVEFAVASITDNNGTKYYGAFAEAWNAIKAGDVLAIYEDVTVANTLTVPFELTIDGNGNTLTYTGTNRAIDVPNTANGADFTIEDITIVANAERGINYNTTGAITLNNVTVEGTSTYALNLPGSSDGVNVTINNSSLTGRIALNVWGENSTINATASDFISVDNSTAEGYAAIALNNDGTTNCAGTVATIDGGSIIAKDENGNPSTAVSNAAAASFTHSVNNETVIVGEIKTPVAIVAYEGSTQFYSCYTLQAAIDKAANDAKATVKVLRDITASEIVTIEGAVKIDGNNYTLTSTAGRAINVNYAGEVVISDLTIATTNKTERAINVIEKAATLTLNNVNAEGFKYTINVAASGAGSTITTEGGKFSGYAAVNITANNTTFTSNGTEFVGLNNISVHESNNYAVIAVNALPIENVNVNINGGKVTAIAENNRQFIAVVGEAVNTNITIDAELALANGDVLHAAVQEGLTIKFGEEYADELFAQGYTTSAAVNGLVEVTGYAVAKIAETGKYYATLPEAVAAAEAGQTVEVQTNAEGAGVKINKSVTIDFGGYTYTINQAVGSAGTESQGFQLLMGAENVTIKNGSINIADNANVVWMFNDYAKNFTVENLNIDCADMKGTQQYVLVANNQHGTNPQVVFNNVNVTNFNYGRNQILLEQETTLTTEQEYTIDVPAKYVLVREGNVYSVVPAVASITADEVTTYYVSLAAAVEAAQAGQTVTLLDNARGAGVVINKNVTIDFAGYIYTANKGVGSAGTETLGFQILKNNDVTLTNGTFVAGEGIKMLVQNYANLTVKDMTLDGTSDIVQYVLSNNSGTTNITGATNITANANGVAFDVYDYTSGGYPQTPVVNVNTTGVIDGKIEVSATIANDLNIAGGYFTTEIEEAWCADGYIPTTVVVDGVTYYSVKAGTYVARNTNTGKPYEKLAAAITEVKDGETIVLLNEKAESVTIKQTANKSFTIDGNNNTYTGTITIDGNKRSSGKETLTIKNVNFLAEGQWQSSIFAQKSTYAHNVTIDGCTFTGTDAKQAYGIKLHHSYNIVVKNTTGTKLYDLVYAQTVVAGLTAENVTVTESGMGFMLPYGKKLSFKNVELTVSGAGVGIYNYNSSTATFEDCKITAEPAIHLEQKNASNAYTIVLNGTNEFVSSDSWMEVIGTDAKFKVTANDASLDMHKTSGLIAAVGNDYYNTFDFAYNAGDEITVIKPVVIGTDKEYNFDNKTIEGDEVYPIFRIQDGATMTVNGDGTVENNDYVFVLGASDGSSEGNLTIENGTFHGTTTVASVTKGTLTIVGGEFSVEPYQGSYAYLINCIDANYKDGSAKVEIKGGIFHNWNPQNNAAEGAGTDFCHADYAATEIATNVWEVLPVVAKVGEARFATIADAVNAAQAGQTVTVVADHEVKVPAVVEKDITLDLNGKAITGNVYPVVRVQNGANVTVTGNGSINNGDYVFVLGASDGSSEGKLTIESGTFHGTTTVASVTKGTLTIVGGEFSVEPYQGSYAYLINCIDANYTDGTADVEIMGGIFHNWNPQNNAAEGVNTNFCVDGYAAAETSANVWEVFNAIAKIDDVFYPSVAAAVAAAVDGDEIIVVADHEMKASVVVEKNITLNLNAKAITAQDFYPVVRVQGGANVTVTGEGTITNNDYVFVLGASDETSAGNLTIENGMFVGETTVASVTKGLLTINGGEYKVTNDATYLINCIDRNNANGNGTALVSITGGKFHGFDPENNNAENPQINFCAEGYLSDDNGDGTFTVRKGEYVAEILGGAQYESIQAAIDAAAEGDVINVIKDHTYDCTNVKQSLDGPAIAIVEGKDVTIDFCGKTITVDATNSEYTSGVGLIAAIHLQNGGGLTVKDSSANAEGGINAIAGDKKIYSVITTHSTSNKLVIENGNYRLDATSAQNLIYGAIGNITVNGGNFYLGNATNDPTTAPWIFNVRGNGDYGAVTVNGGNYNVRPEHYKGEIYIAKEYAIAQTSDATYPYSVVPAVARIDETGYASIKDAVDAANDGEEIVVTVSHELTETVIVNKSVNIAFADDSVELTYSAYPAAFRITEEAAVTVESANITRVEGGMYAFILGASDASSAGNLTINGGTFFGQTSVVSVTKGALAINGGEFSVNPYVENGVENYNYLINCIDANYIDGTATVAIMGGSFHNFDPENNAAEGQGTNFCPEGFISDDNGDGSFTVRPGVYVAKIGEVKYEKVQAAINAAVSGETIELLRNVTEKITIGYAAQDVKKITIDLGGNTLTSTDLTMTVSRGGTEVTIVNGTVTGNSTGGTIRVTWDGILKLGQDVIVKSGGQAKAIYLDNGSFIVEEDTNVNIYGGIGFLDADNNNQSGTPTVNYISIASGYYEGDLEVNEASICILTGGTFTQDVQEWVAEGYASVNNNNGTWTVMPEQAPTLYKGWNWFSAYVELEGQAGMETLQNALAGNATLIKNQLDNTQYYAESEMWYGNLTEASVEEMYMIKMTADHKLHLTGNIVNPEDHPITLKSGWTWIGYPMNQTVSLNDALADIDAQVGDHIKGLGAYAEYYEGYGWWGTLNSLEPGKGYIYHNILDTPVTFTYSYPAEGSRSEARANVTSENNYWVPASSQYANNMTITAIVEGVDSDYEVAAFVNGEVRGSARPIYVEPIDAYMLFLTVHGEDVEEMTFKMYDLATGEEYDLNDRMNYSNDAIVGSISEPYVFSRGTTGIGEASLNEVNIYPNPTTTGREINLEATCDKVEVFNALGVKIAEYQNVDSIDAFETAGVYVIRITDNNEVKHCRLVVR